MSDLDTRLSGIFRAAFPNLKSKNVSEATRDSMAEWDSIAAVTLLTLVEEEFGQRFDPDEAAQWTSYREVREALQEQLGE